MPIHLKTKLSHGTSRYFIAIVPPSPVLEEVHALKIYFMNKYQSRAALSSPPHITVCKPFLWSDEEEGLLISSLSDFAATQKPATIDLSNFSSFAPAVIFIAVSENESLRMLQQELLQFCKTKLKLLIAESEDLTFRPHLTLAFRDLKKSMFVLAWEEFSKKTFSVSFILDRITLLKHNKEIWEPYKDFHF